MRLALLPALASAVLLSGAPALAAGNGPAARKAAAPAAADKAKHAPHAEGDKAKHAHAEGEACHHPPDVGQKAPAPAPGAEQGWTLTRGAPLQGAPAVALAALLKDPAAHDGKTVRLEGTVRKACERKGCWMELAEGAGAKAAGVRVTFKDYGFFVPLDSAGSRARVEGVVKVAALDEGTAKHYEAEGATVPRGADGKPREVQLVASGVELRR